ncbi:GYD domain-containing protein [Marimonas arenosa]|uniref:GYD domain-containing protein n=1 Tax=Marimonas arenosa TaxID=1795305 RepID=A0AAE4B5J2_9RHOB|nr:GYD domain-containing protein [Marimonas arenosa]MDQ2091222.1 GYD domain-containing protein [Marimonas arenosa]
MALFMWMAKYTPEAVKAIAESGSNREDVARATVEAAGGKLLGFYGLVGQDYHVALLCDMPGIGEYVGVVLAASLGGAIADFKSIPMYDMAEATKVWDTYAKVKSTYAPPG